MPHTSAWVLTLPPLSFPVLMHILGRQKMVEQVLESLLPTEEIYFEFLPLGFNLVQPSQFWHLGGEPVRSFSLLSSLFPNMKEMKIEKVKAECFNVPLQRGLHKSNLQRKSGIRCPNSFDITIKSQLLPITWVQCTFPKYTFHTNRSWRCSRYSER